ncbi:hypothetical protein V5O48_008441 [Marasmius crinis-equi]|uniref:Integral membrane protein n=1 Tax=Marasmius crinis-equi TaxID=585013 RepID=A0ABR3FEF7_9AGAR
MAAGSAPAPPTKWDFPENRVLVTVFHVLAILFTVLRLTRRIRIQRLSWDDAWATVAGVLITIYLIIVWVKWKLFQDRRLTMDASTYLEGRTKITFVNSALFTAIVWTSRISLALSISRILPPSRLRTAAIWLSVACFLAGSAIIIVDDVLLKSGSKVGSSSSRAMVIFKIIADIVSSTLLVSLPLYALYTSLRMSLPSAERRLIIVLFTGTLLTLGTCFAQTIFSVEKDMARVSYSVHLEMAISVIVCNFLVVITMLFKLLVRCHRKSPETEPDGHLDTSENGHDNEDYNSGEHAISLGNTRTSRAFTTTYPESQLTEVGETQTYSLGSAMGSGGLMSGSRPWGRGSVGEVEGDCIGKGRRGASQLPRTPH